MRALKGVGAFSEEEDRLLALYVECHGGKGLKGCINWGGVVEALKGKRNTMECQNRHHTLRRLNGKIEKVEVDQENLITDIDRGRGREKEKEREIEKDTSHTSTVAGTATATAAVRIGVAAIGVDEGTATCMEDMISIGAREITVAAAEVEVEAEVDTMSHDQVHGQEHEHGEEQGNEHEDGEDSSRRISLFEHYDRAAAVVAYEELEPDLELNLNLVVTLDKERMHSDGKVVGEVEIVHRCLNGMDLPSESLGTSPPSPLLLPLPLPFSLSQSLPHSTSSSHLDFRIPSEDVVEEVVLGVSRIQEDKSINLLV